MARRRYQKGTLRKRGKRNPVWELQWREDFIQADGKIGRRLTTRILGSVKGMPYRQACKAADEMLRPLNLGKLRPESTITLADFVDRYFIPNAFPTLKLSTQKRYRQTLNYHLLPALGSIRLMDLTTVVVQRYVLDKTAAGSGWEVANHLRNLISKVFACAKRWGLFSGDNPALGVELPEKQPVREKHALTLEQVGAVLAALPEPVRTMVRLGLLTSMRVGEILALEWDCVDYPAGEIHVRRSIYRGVIGTPKTRKSRRTVPMPVQLAEALRAPAAGWGALRVRDAKGNALQRLQLAEAAHQAGGVGAGHAVAQLAHAPTLARYALSAGRRVAGRGAGATGPRQDVHHARTLHDSTPRLAAGDGGKARGDDGE